MAGRLFYLALKPALFGPTVHHLHAAGLLQERPGRGFVRVVAEKPFGVDEQSAHALNTALLAHLSESQLYRIDHYLGKETVQNLLAFRFQNAIFEPLWNRRHIDSVEISVTETVGMEGGRGGYYDTAGALRDMVQNHLLQVLALVAMEPPASMDPDAIRHEKLKVFQALTPFRPERVAQDVVRAQYTAGPNRDTDYRGEAGVDPGSQTETYVAIRAALHTWRWNGVPFFLRSGKCLHRRATEVVLNFRAPPVDLFTGPVDGAACALRPNQLRILIQPEEGFRLGFLVKQPGSTSQMRMATLGMDYADLQTTPTTPAYQRLMLDAIEGNPTLFIRGDETEAAWRWVDSIRAGWTGTRPPPMHRYPAGSHGPVEADDLWRGCEGTWVRSPP